MKNKAGPFYLDSLSFILVAARGCFFWIGLDIRPGEGARTLRRAGPSNCFFGRMNCKTVVTASPHPSP